MGLEEIREAFGDEVARLVQELTNPSKGAKAPRVERKAQERAHLAEVSREARIIKLIDRVDNLREMDGAPEPFLRLYLEESRLLVGPIGEADEALRDEPTAEIRRLEEPKTDAKRADGDAAFYFKGPPGRPEGARVDVDLDRVWDTITDDLPPLISALERILSDKNC